MACSGSVSTDWHVGGPVDLLTRVVTKAGFPTTVEDGLLSSVRFCLLYQQCNQFSFYMSLQIICL